MTSLPKLEWIAVNRVVENWTLPEILNLSANIKHLKAQKLELFSQFTINAVASIFTDFIVSGKGLNYHIRPKKEDQNCEESYLISFSAHLKSGENWLDLSATNNYQSCFSRIFRAPQWKIEEMSLIDVENHGKSLLSRLFSFFGSNFALFNRSF